MYDDFDCRPLRELSVKTPEWIEKLIAERKAKQAAQDSPEASGDSQGEAPPAG